jgi:hypothetical protein
MDSAPGAGRGRGRVRIAVVGDVVSFLPLSLRTTMHFLLSGGNSSRGSGTGVAFCDSVLDSGFRALEARGLDRWSLEGICPSGDWGSAIVADLQFGLVIG